MISSLTWVAFINSLLLDFQKQQSEGRFALLSCEELLEFANQTLNITCEEEFLKVGQSLPTEKKHLIGQPISENANEEKSKFFFYFPRQQKRSKKGQLRFVRFLLLVLGNVYVSAMLALWLVRCQGDHGPGLPADRSSSRVGQHVGVHGGLQCREGKASAAQLPARWVSEFRLLALLSLFCFVFLFSRHITSNFC